jgi:type II secretory ATPase GspE/PulE/Tfp pilus assembly ATPase PilB-like protein
MGETSTRAFDFVKRDSARLIRQTADSQDMHTLMQSGWAHIKNGTTTIEDVMRFAELESEE